MKMKILKDDLNFLKELANDFFQQTEIVNKLNQFIENQIKGWEIWLQVEFAVFLFNHPNVSEIEREKRYECVSKVKI